MLEEVKKNNKKQIKRPLQVNCFKCSSSFLITYNRGRGEYIKKNDWGYWTENKESKDKICDKCLIKMYKEDKWEYLENITDEGKRRILRTYIYDRTLN